MNKEIIPKISVILPVYNGGQYLLHSVESVLTQEFEDFELLIIDDHSNDGSVEYLSKLTDSRIQVYYNESNKGLFPNLNYLIQRAKSDLIKLWAQDDIMLPNCLSEFVSFHQRNPEIGFSYSQRIIINENGIEIENSRIDHTPDVFSKELHTKIAYYTGSIAGNISNVTLNKTAMQRVGLFDESMRISADFDMWVRMAEHFPIGHINHKLIKLRDHQGQLSRKEEYYINHVKEDLIVYRKLDGYSSASIKSKGRKLLRQKKLLFYYTLMLKNIVKLRIALSLEYFKILAKYDNIFILTYFYFLYKVSKKSLKDIPQWDHHS